MRFLTLLLAVALVLPATARLAHAEDPAPAEAVSDAEIQTLVDQLGHDDFKIREAASRKLAQLGDRARPALEKAATDSGSLEARWRAQQLLRRLGGAEKPKVVDEAEAPEAPRGRDNPFGIDQDEVERMKKMIEEWQERFRAELGKDRWPGAQPFGTRIFPGAKVKAPGLELTRTREGVKLTVIDESGAGAEARKTYEGESLDAILRQHPELAAHEGMQELKAKSKDPFQQLRDLMRGTVRFGAPGLIPGVRTITSGQGVEITQDANGATVKIKEKDENGEWVTKEYTGKTLEEIKRKHPEIADKLGMRLEIRWGKPQIFGLDEVQKPKPAPVVTPSRPDEALFGIVFETPSELLAMHLKLEKGAGALVVQVMEGSQAEALGIQRGDIIVRVDQDRIATSAQLVRLLNQAAQNQGPLEVEVIRRGARRVLSR